MSKTCFYDQKTGQYVWQETLITQPQQPQDITVKTMGIFDKNGEIWLVKQTKDKKRLYAMRMREVAKGNERMTTTGVKVNFDFEYVKGGVYGLDETMRMPIEKAKDLYIKYGKCIICGKTLKRKEWIEKGVGCKCAENFKM